MESMVERFLRYTKTNTRSDEAATSVLKLRLSLPKY